MSKPNSKPCSLLANYIVLGPYLISVSRTGNKVKERDTQANIPFLKVVYRKDAMGIEYYLWEKSPVRFTLYDISGRVVSTLVNSNVEAGYHSVNWDAKNLPAGIYFVMLQTDGFTKTTKLVLLK